MTAAIIGASLGLGVTYPGVPRWWPDFCLTYDVVAAAHLAAGLVGARDTTLLRMPS